MRFAAGDFLRWLSGRGPATREPIAWARCNVWTTFTVGPRDMAEAIADRMMAFALRPENAGRAAEGVGVLRVVRDHSDQFYFTPAAAAIFEPFLEQHGARGCEPPGKAARGGYFRLYCGYVAVWVPWDGNHPLPSVRD